MVRGVSLLFGVWCAAYLAVMVAAAAALSVMVLAHSGRSAEVWVTPSAPPVRVPVDGTGETDSAAFAAGCLAGCSATVGPVGRPGGGAVPQATRRGNWAP